MNILVCVKRVPATGGRIVLTADGQDIDTRFLGFTISPHEECGVEEAVRIVEAQGGSSTVLTLGPAEARGAAPRRDGDRHRPGDPARDRRRRLGPDRDGRRDRRGDPRAQEAANGAVRPDPVRQRGGRHRRLPGRDPGRDGARPAGRQRGQGHRGRPTAASSARREAAGGGWEIFELPLPAVARREGGAEPAALPVACRAGSGRRRRRSGAIDRRRGGRAGPTKDRPPTCPKAEPRAAAEVIGQGADGGAGGRRPARGSSGSWADERPSSSSSSTPAARRTGCRSRRCRSPRRRSASRVEALVVGRWSTELAGGSGRSRDRHRARRRRPAPGGVRAGGLGGVARAARRPSGPLRSSSPPAATAATRSSPTSAARLDLPMAANVIGDPRR